jgi:hypothetical protein
MAVNTTPIFTKSGLVQGLAAALTTANTAMDGTGTLNDVFTAGADGALAIKLVCRALGTNVATVLRVFYFDGTTNRLFTEMSIPGTTAVTNSALAPFEIPLGLLMKSGDKLKVTLGAAIAAGVMVSVVGASYTA